MVDIVVIDTSEETLDVIVEALAFEGWSTARAYVVDFKLGRQDISAFFTTHNPRVVVWDVAIPYQENWAYLQTVRALPAARGRRFIVTTTNRRVLAMLVAEATGQPSSTTEVLELIGRPFDLEELITRIQRVFTQQ